jgi:uncharacterized membrane protein YdbT with pleckstrin-like domain
MADEQTIWKGTSSAIRNLHIYLLAALVCLVWAALCGLLWSKLDPSKRGYAWLALSLTLAPILYALWKHILLRSRQYEITTERILIRSGLLSKRTEEIELYRVKDYVLTEPFWQRLFGVGTIEISTHDESTPKVLVEAIRNARSVVEEVRKNVEICRERKKVRLAELE